AGEHIWLIFAAANRDPEMFSEPDSFSVNRENARDHLAFGHGEHFCIGATLARSEARIAMERILQRMENIHLDEHKNNFQYEESFIMRGLKELHIAFDVRT
ncbi:MAG: cytochrome P450, partial [Acidimicrobiales bacterium]|nr:cytochrome P450 [Acidimicrobiales bacterium]